ncbi:MAG: NYN domain-containing protein [Acetatifactor sp.]|nr:NYN domain-containing protein [Acetatifactor sp.]
MKEITERLTEDRMQFAVLIDSDNVSSKYAATIFEELDKYGLSTYRRIYGNWSKGNGWNESLLLDYSILPVQQFSYTSGKNATDMAMVIDAMDILYRGKVQGFCLVTSDSDFTRLAVRLREENMFVLGMGESKTPQALTRACNRFIHLNLVAEQNKASGVSDADVAEETNVTTLREIKEFIYALLSENGGQVDLAQIGNRLNDRFSDFDVRNYGYTKLSTMVGEECRELCVLKESNQQLVSRKNTLSKEELEKEIERLIRKSGGTIDNLSTLNDELHKKYKHLDLKQFGYSRISSFLRSMKTVKVTENTVSLKKE